jgi:AraC-like DNA-binding protein
VQYIDDNIKNDITAEDLAQYAHLSLRSLYMLFEKSAKMTPKCFIRRKKLERVYSTLMNPALQVANVTAVALDYGFTHLGRFSEAYKATFGCLPSESLRKAQSKS